MSNFELFRSEIKKYIYDKDWPLLRPIQESALKFTITSEDNMILAARTASGKTEAAFLPAINSVEVWGDSVKILYVSPLKSLINDQFRRVNELCEYLSVEVTSWHGESNLSAKQRLVKNPEGVLLITPESIEAMLVEHPEYVYSLFNNLEWVIVDEMHSFLANDRGNQLKSLFDRLRQYSKTSPRFIGLSATISKDDYSIAKTFFGGKRDTKVLLDKQSNGIDYNISFHPTIETNKVITELGTYAEKESMLIFPNSKAVVEEVAVKLASHCNDNNIPNRIFAHHANVSKEMRLEAERFALESEGKLFSIVATSTLELGLDLGDVDSVVQYGAPFSVTSLAQRIGRSGRRTGISVLHLIADNEWSLLQSIAALSLALDGEVDRLDIVHNPYDVLAHQILAITIENNGIKIERLLAFKNQAKSWSFISDDDFMFLLRYMNQEGFIDTYGDEIIFGYNSERFRRTFYAHFDTDSIYRVNYEGRRIGEVSFRQKIELGKAFYLAGHIWRIIEFDEDSHRISVIPGTGGEAPIFPTSTGKTTDLIRRRMRQILFDGHGSLTLNENEISVLSDLRNSFEVRGNLVWKNTDTGQILCTFRGTKVNATLLFMLEMRNPGRDITLMKDNFFYGEHLEASLEDLKKDSPCIKEMSEYLFNNPIHLDQLANKKYMVLLPRKIKVQYVLENELDIEGAMDFLYTI